MMLIKKILHGMLDSTGHGMYNIIISNIVTPNLQFPFGFQDITLFVEFMNKFPD